jgi:hypothetical protein
MAAISGDSYAGYTPQQRGETFGVRKAESPKFKIHPAGVTIVNRTGAGLLIRSSTGVVSGEIRKDETYNHRLGQATGHTRAIIVDAATGQALMTSPTELSMAEARKRMRSMIKDLKDLTKEKNKEEKGLAKSRKLGVAMKAEDLIQQVVDGAEPSALLGE